MANSDTLEFEDITQEKVLALILYNFMKAAPGLKQLIGLFK